MYETREWEAGGDVAGGLEIGCKSVGIVETGGGGGRGSGCGTMSLNLLSNWRVLYTPPHVPMDSMSTHVQSTLSLHGLHEHSMSTRCRVHEESMDFMAVFPTVYMDSMWTPYGLHEHSAWSP
jgi:hypothetical protein